MTKLYTLKALTDIWTGDVAGKGGRLIPTGLLGSIRWWFEILVRGLGGKACDPTVKEVCCPDKAGRHCVVCELFGCTGWARKFRFEVLDEDGQPKQDQIRKDETFILRFTELRPIREEEWCLLDLTLRLIAEYGAIGGKTVLKPSDEPGLADLDLAEFEEANGKVRVKSSRHGIPLKKEDIIVQIGFHEIDSLDDLRRAVSGKEHGDPVSIKIERDGKTEEIDAWFGKRHHIDYGLIKIIQRPKVLVKNKDELRRYVSLSSWRDAPHSYRDDHGRSWDFAWASLANFWCVKGQKGQYLARKSPNKSSFNQVVGRQEPKNQGRQLRDGATEFDRWLAGCQRESKKVFSFKEPSKARRIFGFVNPTLQDSNQRPLDFNEVRRRLREVWSEFQDSELLEGGTILQRLLGSSSGGVP
jgi:CRISPR type III-B/RAMP module RAMP protein Cmr1